MLKWKYTQILAYAIVKIIQMYKKELTFYRK